MTEQRDNYSISRRRFVGALGWSGVMLATPSVAAPRKQAGSLGERLYKDVVAYAGLGDHRTASRGDQAATLWLADRLRRPGYSVQTPTFAVDLFEPDTCSVMVSGMRIEGFPAWPVVPTAGVAGELKELVAGDLKGAIALVVLPYKPGAAFVVQGYGSTVLDAQNRGAAAIVVVTQGPTGGIVALNAHLERFAWRVPVVLVAGREAERLTALARSGAMATVTATGRMTRRAPATNVVGIRNALPGAPPGDVILTTPKSGWFTCAGERGAGIAIFLALADALARSTPRRILAVCTSGHELEGLGGEDLLKNHSPPPADVRLWTHIGANVASNVVDLTNGVRRTAAINPQRGILAPAYLLPEAARAFAGQPGYETPVDIESPRAVGEVVLYRRDGYHRLIGLVGGHALHHTRLDTPENATSPAALEPVARAVAAIVKAGIAGS